MAPRFREIKSPNDEEKLQNDLDELQKWSDTWLLKFHPKKCKVLTVSNRKMAEKEANNYHVYDNEGKEVKLRDKKNRYSNSRVVRKKNSKRNKKTYPPTPCKLNGLSLS
jgi:hypothetical protein